VNCLYAVTTESPALQGGEEVRQKRITTAVAKKKKKE
jgi:hypothetical protein